MCAEGMPSCEVFGSGRSGEWWATGRGAGGARGSQASGTCDTVLPGLPAGVGPALMLQRRVPFRQTGEFLSES